MEENQKIEELERRIATLEEQIKILNETSKATQEKLKIEELQVERINIVEKDGTVRICIHSKDRIPCKRRSQAGMLFFAEDSSEVGALLIGKTQNLTFDQFHSDQVVGLVNWENIKGLYVWDRPPGSMVDFKKQFTEKFGRQPTVQEMEFPRVFAGRWVNEEAKVSLSDSKGRERLRLIVDSKDAPRIEMLDENGEILNFVAPEGFKPPELPSTKSLPKDQSGRTPAHLLGFLDYNFDMALGFLDQSREKLSNEVYTQWREWLLKAKKMNTEEKAK